MNHTEYIEKWKVAMKDAYELARQNISKATDDDKPNNTIILNVMNSVINDGKQSKET